MPTKPPLIAGCRRAAVDYMKYVLKVRHIEEKCRTVEPKMADKSKYSDSIPLE
jgi:hypothetical protein